MEGDIIFLGMQENARYLFSALLQSQAALFGIIVSIAFIALQVKGKTYFSVLLEKLKKDKRIFLIGFVFTFSFIFNLSSLLLVQNTLYGKILFVFTLIAVIVGSITISSLFWAIYIIVDDYLNKKKFLERLQIEELLSLIENSTFEKDHDSFQQSLEILKEKIEENSQIFIEKEGKMIELINYCVYLDYEYGLRKFAKTLKELATRFLVKDNPDVLKVSLNLIGIFFNIFLKKEIFPYANEFNLLLFSIEKIIEKSKYSEVKKQAYRLLLHIWKVASDLKRTEALLKYSLFNTVLQDLMSLLYQLENAENIKKELERINTIISSLRYFKNQT